MPPTSPGPRRRRADAAQNADRIVDAAVSQLRARPDATITSIARHAGLARVTVYGHFSSRAELVDAAAQRVMAEGDGALDVAASHPDPIKAVTELIELSWDLMDHSRSIVLAASEELSMSRLRELHRPREGRVTALIERGQARGVFRDDLPAWWLVTSIHSVFHGAGSDLTSNRLVYPRPVSALITATVLALLLNPAALS